MPEQYTPDYVGDEAPPITQEAIDEGDFYVARLVENTKVWSNREYTAGKVQCWRQVFEHLDMQWEDGNPVKEYQPFDLFLQNPKTGAPIWKGHITSQVAAAFTEVCGHSLLPDDVKKDYPTGDPFIGAVFKLRTQVIPGRPYTDKDGNEREGRALFLQIPVEFLGADFQYTGPVLTRKSRGNQDGAATTPVDTTPDGANNPDAVKALLTLLDGQRTEAMKTLVGQLDAHPVLNSVSKMFGMSLKGGLFSGKILERMQEKGIITIDNGTIMTTTTAGVPA